MSLPVERYADTEDNDRFIVKPIPTSPGHTYEMICIDNLYISIIFVLLTVGVSCDFDWSSLFGSIGSINNKLNDRFLMNELLDDDWMWMVFAIVGMTGIT